MIPSRPTHSQESRQQSAGACPLRQRQSVPHPGEVAGCLPIWVTSAVDQEAFNFAMTQVLFAR